MSIKYIMYILIGWNLITFLMMALDKYKSMHGKWRIKEDTLILSAFIMGAPGSIMGAILCHHKTSTWKFRILLPVALIFNLSLVFLIWYYLLK